MNQIARSPKQLGAIIRNQRLERNLSQQALADLMGTGQKTISRIETGHEGMKLGTLFSIISTLELDMRIVHRSKGDPDMADIFQL